MKSIRIEPTTSTPRIIFDWEKGTLEITGESYPENTFEFYQPVISRIDEYLAGSDAPFTLHLGLVYINTSTIKCLMDILDRLERAHGGGRPVAVQWHYDEENERALEMGEEFKEDLSLPFDLIPVASGS